MGNLAAAFRSDHDQELGEIATRLARAHPYYAELVAGHPMVWFVAQTWAGQEVSATAHLAARGIGAYLPMMLTRRDDGSVRQRPMFPEYVFLCVSDISSHRSRLLATPGFRCMLLDGGREAIVPDWWMLKVQRTELAEMIESGEVELIAKKKGKRHGKRYSPEPSGPWIVSMACKSHWKTGDDELGHIEALDDSARVDLLHKALGLSATSVRSDEVPG